MKLWNRFVRFLAILSALSPEMFKAVAPHLPLSETILAWVGAVLPARKMKSACEPEERSQLIADVGHRAPSWSSVQHLALSLDTAAAWSEANGQLQAYKSFLERATSRKEAGASDSSVRAACSRILETCAVHLDYLVFLRATLRDPVKVATLRSTFTKQNSLAPFRNIEQPIQAHEATIKQIWSTLLSETPSKRSDNLLLLDVWTSANQQLGQLRAAASVVYSMLLLDFLKECGDPSRAEQVCEIYGMVAKGALAVTDADAHPTSWFSQLAALALGMSSTPKARC